MTAIKAQGRLLCFPEVPGTRTPHCISEVLCQSRDKAHSRTSSAQMQSDICDALLVLLPPLCLLQICSHSVTRSPHLSSAHQNRADQMTGTISPILSDRSCMHTTILTTKLVHISGLSCIQISCFVQHVTALHYISSISV